MSSHTEAPDGRWWGRPLAETRWQLELARLLVDPVLRGHDVPRGDGRPVLLMPGFLAGDQTLLVLATWLRTLGYRPDVTIGAHDDAASVASRHDRSHERARR